MPIRDISVGDSRCHIEHDYGAIPIDVVSIS